MNMYRPIRLLPVLLGFFAAFIISVPPACGISIIDEKKIAKEFMAQIETHKTILYDPVVTHLTDTVGRIIIDELPGQPFEFHFYILHDDTFNAFASPAANIFINTGLISSLETVDEFAGVIAHEVAHAVSRHVSESIDRSKLVSAGTLAGILAGALIGKNADEDLGQGVVVGSLAAGQSTMLTFTRENETEADQKGLSILKSTCFSSAGLLSGLQKIRAADWQGIEGIPDYFKTHPGTKSRIAHIVSLLESDPPTEHTCRRDFRYDMVRNRIIGLYLNTDKARETLTALLAEDPENPALNYGMALVLDRKARSGPALDHLKTALKKNPFDPLILVEMGRIHQEAGHAATALDILSGIADDPVIKPMVTFYRAKARLDAGRIEDARSDFESVIFSHSKTFPKARYHLADIYSRLKDTGNSHFFLGEYYKSLAQSKNAVVHYKKALETLTDPSRIEAARQAVDQLSRSDR